jgi:hypothetical protein
MLIENHPELRILFGKFNVHHFILAENIRLLRLTYFDLLDQEFTRHIHDSGDYK